jgi:hypothetical protein
MGDDEQLTGVIQAKEASDIEERFARALYKLQRTFTYEYDVDTAVSIPGEQRVVDFIVDVGGIYQAFEIDGEFAHKTLEKKEEDMMREIVVNEALGYSNILPIVRVSWELLQSQAEADYNVRRLI